MSDIQEEREYFKECSRRYEKKSKSEQHAKIQTNLSALQKCGKVWEFGHEINFNDPRDRRNYLVYVAEWLASITYRATLQNSMISSRDIKNVTELLYGEFLATEA